MGRTSRTCGYVGGKAKVGAVHAEVSVRAAKARGKSGAVKLNQSGVGLGACGGVIRLRHTATRKRTLPKLDVVGSMPVSRSTFKLPLSSSRMASVGGWRGEEPCGESEEGEDSRFSP